MSMGTPKKYTALRAALAATGTRVQRADAGIDAARGSEGRLRGATDRAAL